MRLQTARGRPGRDPLRIARRDSPIAKAACIARVGLLTLFDIAIVAFAVAVLWIGNAIKWESGTTPIPPNGLQPPILILVGCVALAVGRWLTRIRR